MTLLLVALAGAFGGGLRVLVDAVVRRFYGDGFPWGTLVVNVSAAFALGVLTGVLTVPSSGGIPESVAPVVGVGLLGGYSTFSTASVETALLLKQRRWRAAIAHGTGMVGAAVLAAMAGVAVSSAMAW